MGEERDPAARRCGRPVLRTTGLADHSDHRHHGRRTAVAGAGLLGLKDLRLGLAMGYTPAQLLTGFVIAAVSGGLAIRWLLSVLRRGHLVYFAAYCLLAGAAVLVFTKG